MSYTTIEIKAKSNNQEQIRKILKSKNAVFHWIDNQIDTYFKVSNGRLKLREGNIENYLIFYERENQKGPKQSNVTLFTSNPESSLKDILINSLGVLTIVNKTREIYFIDNIKFHIDNIKNLGTFIEIEVFDYDWNIEKEKLLKQCNFFLDLFHIKKNDLISSSYSDLLLEK